MAMSQLSILDICPQLLNASSVGDPQAEFDAEQEKLKQLSYLSAAEQKKFADRQSLAFMYMKPPGYDAAQKRTEQVWMGPKMERISLLIQLLLVQMLSLLCLGLAAKSQLTLRHFLGGLHPQLLFV